MRAPVAIWIQLAVAFCANAQTPGPVLRLGASESGQIVGGSSARFKIALPANTVALLAILQNESDLAITVLGADGAKTGVWDEFDRGQESVTVRADTPGEYRIEISRVTSAGGIGNVRGSLFVGA